MELIRPSVAKEQVFCVESPAPQCGLVVFGASSGDLTKRKLIPALANRLICSFRKMAETGEKFLKCNFFLGRLK